MLAFVLPGEHVEVLRHRVGKRPSGLQHCVHVGDLALDELELADRLAELLAVVDVRHDAVHHRLHDAERPAGEHGALVVEPAHQHARATIERAEHVSGRHLDVREHQLAGVAAAHAELVQLLCDGKALHALFDQEGGDAAGAELRLGLRVDHQGVGIRPVGDPHLAAVQQVVVALVLGPELHADDVGAGPRLAHRERTDVFAAD